MRSVHIAGAAIGVTVATLSGLAAFSPSANQTVRTSYDKAFAHEFSGVLPARVAADHDGSEHYWLTYGATGPNLEVLPAVASSAADIPPLADIKSAIIAGAIVNSDQIEIVSVQPIARVGIGAEIRGARSLLVTARVEASSRQPARLVNVVVDVGAGTSGHKARSL